MLALSGALLGGTSYRTFPTWLSGWSCRCPVSHCGSLRCSRLKTGSPGNEKGLWEVVLGAEPYIRLFSPHLSLTITLLQRRGRCMSAPDTGLLQSGQSIVCPPALRSLAVTLLSETFALSSKEVVCMTTSWCLTLSFAPSLSRLSPGMQLGTHLCH